MELQYQNELEIEYVEPTPGELMAMAVAREEDKANHVLGCLFFDWFAVGVEFSSLNHFKSTVEAYHQNVDYQQIQARNGYETALKVSCTGMVFTASFGGPNVGSRMLLQASGAEAEPFRAWFLRLVDTRGKRESLDPVLIRADVAIDFDEPGVFDALTRILESVAKSNRLKKSCLGDWIAPNDPKGRTLYVGSRQSPVMVRLYEKGKTLLEVRPDLARLELEIKPKKLAPRREYVTLEARDLVFCNAWSTDLYTRISGAEPWSYPCPPGTVHRETDHERAFAHLVKQYRDTIKTELDNLGGDYMMLLERLLGIGSKDLTKLDVSKLSKTIGAVINV